MLFLGSIMPVMELLSNPRKYFLVHIRKLFPVILGIGVGFLGVANILAFFLEKYPNPSVCLFVGLIAGMLPSLMQEAGKEGRTKGSWIALMISAVVIFAVLAALEILSVKLVPNVGWYGFCGVCLALSVIVPGMSFSTLLMPLGLYTPFIEGLGHLDMSVILPGGIGALVTVVCFAKLMDALLKKILFLCISCHCRCCNRGNHYDYTVWKFCLVPGQYDNKCSLSGNWSSLLAFIKSRRKRRGSAAIKCPDCEREYDRKKPALNFKYSKLAFLKQSSDNFLRKY